MLNTVIVGASGYAGAELAALVQNHPDLKLFGLYVSAGSQDAHKRFSSLHPQWVGELDQPLLPLDEDGMTRILTQADLVLLATAHEVSAELAPKFLAKGLPVFDLSGAFRVQDQQFYQDYYGFTHANEQWLAQAAYGLAEWNSDAIAAAQLIAVPGCYPTASLCALKPLQQAGLIKAEWQPIINAVSGVSGAGRKASVNTSFCEVSLSPYGTFSHRHQPEISHHLGKGVLFQPHLGNYVRGILATIYVQLAEGVTPEQVDRAYLAAYEGKPLVRLTGQMPSIRGVASTPYCDLAWQQQGNMLVVVSAIDNLLKGAASQAIQCVNIKFGFKPATGLI
ncbi:N-acetyl-gamma-glutamyl-phosphate reductase [Aeromonas rivuli]|jgi:N-acetyl-gamma-glutamyl-phosphate reductase|uniref:N-acetyl-gamma-glutamyl-phosphate reductase n=1 Tax=Aeromonas TaxID=642 RepID=UPI0005AB686D|nr:MULTISPECIES: N-acetyl-gamma-glutamyl-phosphate reductase [Aeromonas]MCS3460520.1 N-acetyl-gamma-glutamyl-phosphate reductase [Aeromonas sp. BIGb0445]UBO73626.1 N-acetyl-gamma-glutamyl-phosphate reductase [Aeromonas rivuli]